MKVAYICGGEKEHNQGVFSKVEEQVREWSFCCDGYLIAYTERKVLDSKGSVVYSESLPSWGGVSSGRFLRLLRLYGDYRFIRQAISFLTPDICYSRYMLPIFFPEHHIKSTGGVFVVEINSDDVSEFSNKSYITRFLNNRFRKGFLSRSDGVVYVSNELKDSLNFCFLHNKPYRVIANGSKMIVDDTLSRDRFCDLSKTRLSCVFVGSSDQSWNGVEKILWLAEQCVDIDFKIIGMSKEQCRSFGNVGSNVYCYGYVPEKDVAEIISICNVGISTLSLYEKNMNEASPLKSRQYLSHGLPVIGSYVDTDIESGRYYLQIPNTPDNVSSSLDLIVDFIKKSVERGLREEIRVFAKEKLSFSIKESERLAFFRDLVQND